jgi:hypothetical protein
MKYANKDMHTYKHVYINVGNMKYANKDMHTYKDTYTQARRLVRRRRCESRPATAITPRSQSFCSRQERTRSAAVPAKKGHSVWQRVQITGSIPCVQYVPSMPFEFVFVHVCFLSICIHSHVSPL